MLVRQKQFQVSAEAKRVRDETIPDTFFFRLPLRLLTETTIHPLRDANWLGIVYNAIIK
jgi:hypothetical protein